MLLDVDKFPTDEEEAMCFETIGTLRAFNRKWKEHQTVHKYESEIEKDLDLHENLLQSLMKFQEQYKENLKIATEEKIKLEKEVLEKRQLLLHDETTEQPIQSLIQDIDQNLTNISQHSNKVPIVDDIEDKAGPEISDAIEQLDRIAKSASTENDYDQFGKLIAYELRQLPQRQAILLQSEIQNCITRVKLFCLESLHTPVHPPVHQLYQQPYSEQLHLDIVSPSTCSSSMPTSTQSLNEDDNVDNDHSIINANLFPNNQS